RNGIQRTFQCMNKEIDIGLTWLTAAGWRHLTAVQFSNGLFPDFGVSADIVQLYSSESDAPGAAGGAVAADAICVEHAADRRGTIDGWRSRLGLRRRMRRSEGQSEDDEGQALHGNKPIIPP